ncbi:YopX family protein [Ligilactobacillus sp. LYQ139]|uniref:YopX family protein n=1 Tax=Ligilactobacillus sp. LYQ139 TaxID=3378800 RepID=UPI0038525057
MQDKYRFRAWDKIKKKYIYNVENGLKVCLPSGDTHVMSIAEINNSEHYTLEQCSGVKDKNGQLIYENDIVQVTKVAGYQKLLLIVLENGNFMTYDSNGSSFTTVDRMVNNGTGTIEFLTNKVVSNVHKDTNRQRYEG